MVIAKYLLMRADFDLSDARPCSEANETAYAAVVVRFIGAFLLSKPIYFTGVLGNSNVTY